MSILSIPRTLNSMKRLRQIATILARHGFSHFVSRLHLSEHIPGLGRLMLHTEFSAGSEELSAAKRLARVFEELGATFIKFGQLLSTRPDLVREDFLAAFAQLQDSVDPLPAELMRKTVREHLGIDAEEIFREFEDKPIASGSIGQVHKATLADGTPVVIKIKRPDTDTRVRDDLELLEILAGLIEKYLPELKVLRPRMVVEEFSRCMERELDFVGEASYTEKFSALLTAEENIKCPLVYWDFVTRDTLVLERIEGTSLGKLNSLPAGAVDREELAGVVGRCFMRQFFVTGFFHADPHPGNMLLTPEGRLALIDFGQMGHLSDDMRRQLGVSLLALSQGDTDIIVDIYADLGGFTEKTDLREFRLELRALIDRYYGVPIDRLDLAQAFQDSLAVARNNGLLLPRDFVLLGKSFVTVMGVVRALDNSFRIDEALKPFSRKILGDLFSPGSSARKFGFFLYRLISLIRRAPEDMRDILERIKTGRLRIIYRHEGLEDLTTQIERASNRLTFGLIIVGVTIGSSIVLTAGSNTLGHRSLPVIGETPLSVLFSGLGFGVATVMGLWLAWSILRGKRF
jgi:ubiquinone biosynthesis protein